MNLTDTTETVFRAALEGLPAGDQVVPDAPLGVAVSGGGDSMALLAMAMRAGHELRAVTVDHGLRSEAAGEAEMVGQFCRDAGIRHDVLRLSGLKAGPNLAARARAARYEAMVAWAEAHDVRTILLGHTRDDQAETVLMRLARGSGADGLAAMAPARDWRGILWLRPLLDLDRADLRAWLSANGIGWADDPTNEDESYQRVRVRQAMDGLEALGLNRARLARTAQIMARQREVLEAAGADLARAAVRPGGLGEIYVDTARLAAALTDTALRVLADALMCVSSASYRARLEALEDLLARVTAPDFAGATLSGCTIAAHGTGIVISREPAATAPAPLQAGRQCWDGRWQVDAPEGAGLWIAPLGEDGLQQVSAALRRSKAAPPACWTTAPRTALRAVPAVWRSPEVRPDELAAAPSVGLVLDPAAAYITINPPDAARMRHRARE